MEKKVEEMTEEAIEKMKKQHEFFGFRTEKTMEDLKKKHEFSGYVAEKTMERAEEIVDALKEDK